MSEPTSDEILSGETITKNCVVCGASMTFRLSDIERITAAFGMVPDAVCGICSGRRRAVSDE